MADVPKVSDRAELLAEAKAWQDEPYPTSIPRAHTHWMRGLALVARLVSALEEQSPSEQTECPMCGGTGWLIYEDAHKPCPRCGGTRFIPERGQRGGPDA